MPPTGRSRGRDADREEAHGQEAFGRRAADRRPAADGAEVAAPQRRLPEPARRHHPAPRGGRHLGARSSSRRATSRSRRSRSARPSSTGSCPQVIPNLKDFPEAMKLPAARMPRLRSYVSVPVTLSDGSLYGTFCAAGLTSDKDLTKRDKALMDVLASAAAVIIEPEVRAQERRTEISDRLDPLIADGGPDGRAAADRRPRDRRPRGRRGAQPLPGRVGHGTRRRASRRPTASGPGTSARAARPGARRRAPRRGSTATSP